MPSIYTNAARLGTCTHQTALGATQCARYGQNQVSMKEIGCGVYSAGCLSGMCPIRAGYSVELFRDEQSIVYWLMVAWAHTRECQLVL